MCGCDANAQCKIVDGMGECTCNPGYAGSGKVCTGKSDITIAVIKL